MDKLILEQVVLPTGINWNVLKAEIDFSGVLFKKAQEQARMKSQFTMDADQAGSYRSPEFKYQRQLMGTLAEIFVQKFLLETIQASSVQGWEIIRYDDVREDGFKSPANEYDIKAKKGDLEYFLESRSSIIRDRELGSAINTFHIIGGYSSIAKSQEKMNDFYILPLYPFNDYSSLRYLPTQFENHLRNGKLSLYIAGGSNKDIMKLKGKMKSLQQGSTNYNTLVLSESHDIQAFKDDFVKKLRYE